MRSYILPSGEVLYSELTSNGFPPDYKGSISLNSTYQWVRIDSSPWYRTWSSSWHNVEIATKKYIDGDSLLKYIVGEGYKDRPGI